MKEIDLYIQEKLQINKQTQVYDDDVKLTDEIYDHLLILETNLKPFDECKEFIKQWIKENHVKEVDYWLVNYWYWEGQLKDACKKNPNVYSIDYNHTENINHIIGTPEERGKSERYNINSTAFMYANKKFICLTSEACIYCYKK